MISRIRILKALLSYTRKDDLITLASALSCTFSVISSRNVSKIMSGLQPYLVLNDAKRPQRPQPQPQVRHNGHLSPLLIRHTVINMYPVCTVNNANHEFYSQPSIQMMGDHCVTAELLGRTLKPAESTVRDSSFCDRSVANLR